MFVPLWRSDLATVLACAVFAAGAMTANVSLAEETGRAGVDTLQAGTQEAKSEGSRSDGTTPEVTAQSNIAAIDDKASPPSTASQAAENEKTEEAQPATETPRPDTASTAAPTEKQETHPVLVELLRLLTEQYGSKLKAVAEDDIFAIASFYSAEASKPVWTTKDGLTDRAGKVTEVIRKADDWGLKSSDFELPKLSESSQGDEARAAAELELALAVLKYARHARGGRVRPSSVSRLFDQTPEIADPLEVLKELASSADAGKYLKRLHPQHPQFERLRQALIEARSAKTGGHSDRGDARSGTGSKSKRSDAAIRRILANMERWRWMPRNLGAFYVWDDVTAQMTSVISNGRVLFHEKIVVGKPETPTPMFSADMKYIIFHPSWGVPPGMKKNELWPQLRNSNGGWFSAKPLASSVLRAHDLRVTRGGVAINPDSIDWSKVNIANYHFTQPPGPKNVLGIVKFRFPNRHNIYMHDTPERHLFGDRRRTFSHGCMRVQNPVRLAEVLLRHDKGWDKDEVRQKMRRGASIELSRPIPVHIAYFTVAVDEKGELEFHRDIYGLDRRVVSKLEGRNVAVGSPATKRAKRTKKRKRKRMRRAAKKEKKPFNPFASILD